MAASVLVAYGTKYGSTTEIAEAIGRTLTEATLEAEVRRARTVKSVDRYDAVVLGSAVYMARWRRDAARLLRRRRQQLSERPVWLFSSGPVGEQAEDPDKAARWTRPKLVERVADEIRAREHVVFGGCVSEDRGGPMYKSMAKNTPPDLRDRRDWGAITAWAQKIATELEGTAPRA